MIHLSTLSAVLLRPAVEEIVAAPLQPTTEGEGTPLYAPPHESGPSLPTSSGAGSASLFASLARLFQLPALDPQPPINPARIIAGTPGDPSYPVDPIALNPQPLPPVETPLARPAKITDPLAAVGLNPQPLPPREAMVARTYKITDRLTVAGLNPQPLPPREAMVARTSKVIDRLTIAGLNPQPLPPRERASIINDPLVAAGLNPQPLPPLGDSLQEMSKPFLRLG
jgi:hypothetical protein